MKKLADMDQAAQMLHRPPPSIGGWCGFPAAHSSWGSDRHYPEEAHKVAVTGFWIDVCPVTNRDARAIHTGRYRCDLLLELRDGKRCFQPVNGVRMKISPFALFPKPLEQGL